MNLKNAKVAILLPCNVCRGKGKAKVGKAEISCYRCNSQGHVVIPVSFKQFYKMLKEEIDG
jgi:DnaJ-class molecular chaperone